MTSGFPSSEAWIQNLQKARSDVYDPKVVLAMYKERRHLPNSTPEELAMVIKDVLLERVRLAELCFRQYDEPIGPDQQPET